MENHHMRGSMDQIGVSVAFRACRFACHHSVIVNYVEKFSHRWFLVPSQAGNFNEPGFQRIRIENINALAPNAIRLTNSAIPARELLLERNV
jgi:hypothetical protein